MWNDGGDTKLSRRIWGKDMERSVKAVESVFEKGKWGDRDRQGL